MTRKPSPKSMLCRLMGVVVLCMGHGFGANAQDRGVYDILLGAVPVGVFAFSGVEAQGRYSLAGQIRTSGLVGALTNVRYDAKAQGRRIGDRFVPTLYEEQATVGDRKTDLSITYQSGVPNPPVFVPPRQTDRPDVDPADQAGTLDLLTALFVLFRDTPADMLCSFSAPIYDGARRTSIALRFLRQSGDEIICAAEYRRIAGFSVAELRRRESFDFRLVYGPGPNGTWRVKKADLESVYGVVTLERRADP